MTPTSTACSSDNTLCSNLVDDTMNVRAITVLDSDTRTPMDKPLTSMVSVSPKLPHAPANASLDITDPGTGNVSSVLDKHKVVQEAPKVPSGHYIAAYKGTDFVLPFEGQPEPFYLITKGKMISILSNWEQASPLVHAVSRGTFCKLHAGITIAEGWEMVEKAIDNKVVKVL